MNVVVVVALVAIVAVAVDVLGVVRYFVVAVSIVAA